MAHYYFDSDDGRGYVRDDVGVELADLDAVRREASLALAEFARDAIPGSMRRDLSICVRTQDDTHVLKATIRFEITLRGDAA